MCSRPPWCLRQARRFASLAAAVLLHLSTDTTGSRDLRVVQQRQEMQQQQVRIMRARQLVAALEHGHHWQKGAVHAAAAAEGEAAGGQHIEGGVQVQHGAYWLRDGGDQAVDGTQCQTACLNLYA